MIEAKTGPRVCQVRSQTDLPCGRQATVTVLGVLLCDRCAREQEGYFAVGELTQVPRGREPRGAVAATRAPLTHPLRAGGVRRLMRQRATGGRGLPFLAIVAVAASVFAAAACGGTEQARAGAAFTEPESGQKAEDQRSTPSAQAIAGGDGNEPAVAKVGDVGARVDGAAARAGDAEAGARGAAAQAGGVRITGDGIEGIGGTAEGSGGPKEVTLTVTGKPGTGFAGSCSVGGEERTFDGEAPKRYAFEPRGKGLECEIRKEGGGALEVVVEGRGVRSVQRTAGGEGALKIAFSEAGISSSTSSVSLNQAATSSPG